MKILIFYTYNKGLLSEFFQELSEKLYKDGNEVFNFYLKHKSDHFKQKGVQIYGEKRRGSLANATAIYKIIKVVKPDVVVSNFSYINPAVLFGRLLGVKRNIAWFHSAYGFTKPSLIKVLNKTLYLNMANVVMANSKQLQAEMTSVYRVPKWKTRSVPFWTNIEQYSPASIPLIPDKTKKIINIGCPGRLMADKNHVMAIKALYELKQINNQSIRLYIAGSGTYRSQLETLVKDLSLEEDVIFLGLLNVHEMTAFYEAMDVVVLPSFHEAFGLVFIEAIALGTPALVSNTFGALDFIDTQKYSLEDFSFNPHVMQELIDKLEPYLHNKGFAPNYFKAMYSETFEKDVIYNQVKSIILNQTIPL